MKGFTIVLLGVFAVVMPAQSGAQGTEPRISVIATGGVSAVDDTHATYGGELTVRLWRIFDATIGATRLPDITAADLTEATERIAGLVGATADAHASATVLEGGLRMRLPLRPAIRPYAIIGGGRARITTTTAFFKAGTETAPGSLGIALAPHLNSRISRGVLFVGAGVDVAAGSHVTFDAGVRYSGIVTERNESPRYYVFPILRFQAGLGIRF